MKKKRGRRVTVKRLNLDSVDITIPLFEYTWKGEKKTIDILKLVTDFSPMMDALKAQPLALVPKFLRSIGEEDMPVEKAVRLLQAVLEEAQKSTGSLSKKLTSALPSSSTSTQDSESPSSEG